MRQRITVQSYGAFRLFTLKNADNRYTISQELTPNRTLGIHQVCSMGFYRFPNGCLLRLKARGKNLLAG